MTRYLEPSFSHFAVGSDEYRANHERIFGKKDPAPPEGTATVTAIEGNTGTTVTLHDPVLVKELIHAAHMASWKLGDELRRDPIFKRLHEALLALGY